MRQEDWPELSAWLFLLGLFIGIIVAGMWV